MEQPTMTRSLALSDELRTEHRLFEPQLSSGLGWLLALVALLVGNYMGSIPPELLSLCCGTVGILLTLRLLTAKFVHRPYAYLVVDRMRDGAYATAIVLAATLALMSVAQVHGLPACAAQEITTALALADLGSYHIADVSAAAMICGLMLLEPLLFRRTLAVQYIWPTSAASYWVRWSTRVLFPALLVFGALGLHSACAGQLWGAHMNARLLAKAILETDPEQKLQPAAARWFEDDAVTAELVTIAMCQRDDELATRLVEVRTQKRPKSEAWTDLVEYVYRNTSK
jgi:hypothetical protein